MYQLNKKTLYRTMSLLKWYSYLCVMFLLAIFVQGLDSPMKTKSPPSSKWLEPYRITITNGNLPELVAGCDNQGTQLLRPGEQLSRNFI